MTENTKGILYAMLAYVLWGILPIYWKLIQNTSSSEILMHRIIWAFFTIIIFIVASKKWNHLVNTLKSLILQKKRLFFICLAAFLVSGNWFIYIWAVHSNQIIEASLGYYINPIMSILLGIIFLKERLNPIQTLSVFIAGFGVFYLAFHYGHFPFIAVILALTFALYGLCKKIAQIDAMFSLFIETMIVFPIALLFFGNLVAKGESSFVHGSIPEIALLIGTGLITILPLLYFGKATQLISLTKLGFIQFISPTISLFIGVFLYNEVFTTVHLVSFLFIWCSCLLFTCSETTLIKKIEHRFSKSKLEKHKHLA